MLFINFMLYTLLSCCLIMIVIIGVVTHMYVKEKVSEIYAEYKYGIEK